MKFFTTPYHFNLLKDNERLAVFHEAITDYHNRNINYCVNQNTKKLEKTVLDIGCGTGVLSFFASKYFKNIIALDIDCKIIECAKKSFEITDDSNKNINFYCVNGLDSKFHEKLDLIICEMLDTALIDEEEIPVLNHLHKYLNENGEIIPKGVINIAEPIFMERNNIHYDDDFCKSKHEILGNFVKYSEFDFSNLVDTEFKTTLEFEIATDSKINGIKITTFTKLNQNIICGPTPMMNPPLLIPIDEKCVKNGERIKISLEYTMGGGLETIKTSIID